MHCVHCKIKHVSTRSTGPIHLKITASNFRIPFTLTVIRDAVLDIESLIVVSIIAVKPQKHLTASVDVHFV